MLLRLHRTICLSDEEWRSFKGGLKMQIVVRTYPDNYEALSKALEAGYKVKFATQIGNMIEYILVETVELLF